MAAYSSTDEDLEREDDSKVRRTAATKPGALLHSGLIMMHRHLGRQVEVCESVDAVQAKGIAAAYLSTARKPNAGSRLGFRNVRELQSLAEAVDLLRHWRKEDCHSHVISNCCQMQECRQCHLVFGELCSKPSGIPSDCARA